MDTMSKQTGTTHHHLADELLDMNMATTGTVMPSRKEMSEPLENNKTGKMIIIYIYIYI
jgi:hypothetical protein